MRDTIQKIKFPHCPRCGGFIPNNQNPGLYPGALSRVDNKTEICSACGEEEALEDLFQWAENEKLKKVITED